MTNVNLILENPIWIAVSVGVCLLSYLFGSLNFAILVSKIFAKEDIRSKGSGNAGMTNMLRIYGKLPAALTAVGDFSKGMLAVWLGRLIFRLLGMEETDISYFVAFFALLGHLYPVYFSFKGGKGVLTAFGLVLWFNPIVFSVLFLIYVPMAFMTRIVSLASILGMLSYPIFTYIQGVILGQPDVREVIFGCVMIAFPIYAHRGNIQRLLTGTERRFGEKPRA